jgi:hypothetical protein
LEAANIAPGVTHIRLRYGYRGKYTQERFIPAGEYQRDNPVLCGLAEYLVENGHAVWVDVAPVAPPAPVVEVAAVPEPAPEVVDEPEPVEPELFAYPRSKRGKSQ